MENVDAGILASINGEGLQSLIENTPYSNASEAQVNPGVNLQSAGEPGGYQVNSQGQNVLSPAQNQRLPGVTPGQSQVPAGGVVMDPAEVQRLRNIAFEATQSRIDAEEETFQASIANLHEDARDRAVLERAVDQYRKVNGWLNNRVQTIEQTAESQRQDVAKRQWGFLISQKAGLPFDNPAIRSAILAANNQQEMQNIAQGLVNVIGQSRANDAVNQVNNGVFAAGGNSGAGQPPSGAKLHSGDLEPLIASRGYQTVNW